MKEYHYALFQNLGRGLILKKKFIEMLPVEEGTKSQSAHLRQMFRYYAQMKAAANISRFPIME